MSLKDIIDRCNEQLNTQNSSSSNNTYVPKIRDYTENYLIDWNSYPYTHTINPYVTTTTTDVGSYYDTNSILKKELENTKETVNYLMKFLIMKGLIKDEQEFKDFIDAVKLAGKLSEKDKIKEDL